MDISDSKPVVKKGKCTGCATCLAVCPTNAIIIDKDGKAKIIPEKCIDCRLCIDVCPYSAIAVPAKGDDDDKSS